MDSLENSVLDFATEIVLKELGCTVKVNGNTATIQRDSIRLNLEKRKQYWFDLEKNLWFYSRAQIVIYMGRNNRDWM